MPQGVLQEPHYLKVLRLLQKRRRLLAVRTLEAHSLDSQLPVGLEQPPPREFS